MMMGVFGLGEKRHKPRVEKVGKRAIRDSLVEPKVGWMGRSLNLDSEMIIKSLLCSHSLHRTVLSIFCNSIFNVERNQCEQSRQSALLGRAVNEIQQKKTVLWMESKQSDF